jgi:hypothetical protein
LIHNPRRFEVSALAFPFAIFYSSVDFGISPKIMKCAIENFVLLKIKKRRLSNGRMNAIFAFRKDKRTKTLRHHFHCYSRSLVFSLDFCRVEFSFCAFEKKNEKKNIKKIDFSFSCTEGEQTNCESDTEKSAMKWKIQMSLHKIWERRSV